MWVARFLLVVPVWWAASPWHVLGHHPAPQSGGEGAPYEARALGDANDPAPADWLAHVDDAVETEHGVGCNTGSCVAIVASLLTVEQSAGPTPFPSVRRASTGVAVSPLPRPPSTLS